MTTYDHDDDRTTVRDDPEHTRPIAFPAQRRHEDREDPAPGQPLFSQELQYDRYGGTSWGAGFFGAVVSVCVAAALAGSVAGASVLLGADPDLALTTPVGSRRAVLLGSAAVLLGVLVVACYAGGYVAGRMSRFDGGRQGLAAWVLALLIGGVTGGSVLLAPARAGLVDLPGLDGMPRPGDPALWWVVGSATVLLLGSLLAAVAGGRLGRQYHQRVDEAGYA